MQLATTLTRTAVFLAGLAMVSMVLTSCPLTATSGNLRLLLATGASGGDIAPGAAGLSPVSPEEIFALYLTIQRATLLAESGSGATNTDVLSAPLTVELVETSGLSLLASEIMAEEGVYTGVEVVLGAVELALSSDPLNPVAVDLPESATIQINFPFEILPDSGGILLVDFGGLSLYHGESGSFVFAPSPAASLREEAHNVRIEGRIAELNRDALSFELAADGATYAVDFEGSSIYRPGDLTTPAGSPGDLQNQFRIAALTSLDLGASIAPARIEVLDLPATSRNEEGDRITICHLHPGDAGSAYTVKVARSLLQDHLDHGDFTGPCEEGEPFTLTYEADPGGAIEGEATQSVLPGASGTPVTAVAEDGFAFLEWSDGRTDNPRTDTAVGADLAVTAMFIEQFTLAYTAGEGGTLSGPTTQQVTRGESGARVTAVRNPGFAFSRWSDGRTDNPRIDGNVTENLSVAADFVSVFTFAYTAGEGGTLQGATIQMVITGTDGAPVTAVPDTGFAFVGWSDGRTDNPRTDTGASANVAVIANFAEEFTLTYAAGPNGAIDGEVTQTVPGGMSGAPVTAVPATGFGFARWSDGRTDNPRIDTAITGNVSVTAEFTAAITLTYLADTNGSISGVAEQIIGTGGTGSPVLAVPDEGYGFLGWSDGRTDNPRVDADVVEGLSVTAIFDVSFDVTYSAGPNGSIEGEIMQQVLIGQNGTAVTALASEGYVFDRWSDGRIDNPRTEHIVSADVSVTALFVEVFTLTYESGTNGSFGEGLSQLIQTVPAGRDGMPVTVTANSGYRFVNWSDGRTDNPRTDTRVLGDLSVAANFVEGVTLVYGADLNGRVSGETSQFVDVGGAGTAVMAEPDEGFLFLQWSDGRTDNPRIDESVMESINVTASFFEMVEMIPVPGGSFLMGNSGAGDDARYRRDDELPRHEVTLMPYEIGRFEITAAQYAEFLNYMAHPSRNLLRLVSGAVWQGGNLDIYFMDSDSPQPIYAYSQGERTVVYDNTIRRFIPETRIGLPDNTAYSMTDFPVTEPTWYGAVLYANWLSERAGLEPVYDIDTWQADFSRNGYHLPTEAQWERAAAWDGERHWVYGITADEIGGRTRVNFHDGTFVPPPDTNNTRFVNPMGIVQDFVTAYVSPVGWFNGINVSPNGNVQTIDSKSPIGAYDMSGNIAEWCHDWYLATFYAESPQIDPSGPAVELEKVIRGGAWGRLVDDDRQRTAFRFRFVPNRSDGIIGFRIAR